MKQLLRKILNAMLMTFMPAFVKRKIMSCQEVNNLLCNTPDLKFTKRAYLNMHLLICQNCSNVRDQLILIKNSSCPLRHRSESEVQKHTDQMVSNFSKK